MRRRGIIVLPAMLLLLALSPAARAEAPALMHYQGVLTDDTGLPVSDTLAMTFHLYEDTLAVSIWTAAIGDVPVLNGFYEVYLDVEGVAFDLPYWLGIEVDGSPLGPKKPLASVPYSMRSAMTKVEAGDGLDGTSDSTLVSLSLADGGVTEAKIADGAVTENKIQDQSIYTAHLVDGAATSAKIGVDAVTNTKIIDGAVTSTKILDGTVVRSLNGLTDTVSLLEGNNITITPGANALTISATVTGGAADSDWVVNGDDVYSQPSGNVGVGTATPGEKLDVAGGNIRTDGKLISTIAAGTPPLVVESPTLVVGLNADQVDGIEAADFAMNGHDHDGGAITTGTIDFNRLPVGTGAAEVAVGNHTHPGGTDSDWTISGVDMYSGVTGNVGIGDSSPTKKLDVNGGIGVEGGLSARSVTGIGMKDASGKVGVWVEDGAEVGIGTDAPAEMLHVYNGGSHSKVQIEAGGSTSNNTAIFLKTAAFPYDRLQIEKYGPTAGGTVAGIPLANLSLVSAGADAGPLMLNVMEDTCMYFGTDNTERMRITSDGWVVMGGNAAVRGSLYVGTALSTNNDAIFFDSGTSESFEWDDNYGRFDLSDDLAVNGTIKVGTNAIYSSSDLFNAFYTATPSSPFSVDMENSGDIFAQDDMEVGDDLHVGDNLVVGGRYNYDDDRILFDAAATAETLYWDNTGDRFQFSKNLAIDGYLWGGTYGPAYADTASYNVLASTLAGPSCGDMASAGDLYISFDLEVGSDIYYSGNLTDIGPEPPLKSGGSAEPVTVAEAEDLLGRLSPIVYRYLDEEEGRAPIERTKIGFDPATLPDLVTTPDKKAYRPVDMMAVLSMIIREQQSTIASLESRVRALEESR